MSESKAIALGNVIETVQTWNPSLSEPEETFKYIDLSAVDQDMKRIIEARIVLCSEAPSRARQLVAKGDVLVSTVRPNLNGVARVPEELDGATASTGFCVLRARPSLLDAGYLFQWVKTPTFVSDMVRKATGASYPAVSDRIVTESCLPLPPLAEQRRIAEVLDRVDELRDKRRLALTQLDTLSQAIYLKMFGDTELSKSRWMKKALEEVSLNITDGKHGDCRPSPNSGYYFISVKDIVEGQIDYSNARQIDYADFFEVHKRTRLELGDVLITNSGTIGKTAIIGSHPNVNRTTFQKSVAIIKPKQSEVDSFFLQASLNFNLHYLAEESSGSSQKNLLLSQLRKFRLIIPPISLQRVFANCVAAVEKLKTAHHTSLENMDELFATIQYRAFRGEL